MIVGLASYGFTVARSAPRRPCRARMARLFSGGILRGIQGFGFDAVGSSLGFDGRGALWRGHGGTFRLSAVALVHRAKPRAIARATTGKGLAHAVPTNSILLRGDGCHF